MAREWSLPETKALVEEHMALKEEEAADTRTASEHWNKVAKRLREKGFNRSHKSCNKRWYRLEQYEVQIFSFNMEEGNNKKKNFWELTRAERLEFRDKWPLLPSGDGIDRDIFDALKRFSHWCKKKEVVSEAVDKEVVLVGAPKAEDTRPPQPPPQPIILPAALFSHPMVTESEPAELHKQPKSMWPAPNDSIQQPSLPSPDALDGFKLQARELRRRRAAELRRNNRTVPYKNTHTTFMKATTPQTETTTTTTTAPFGSALPSLPDFANENVVASSQPPFQLKRPNPFAYQRYTPTETTFQSKKAGAPGGPLLESVNAHVPLLQPQDGHNIVAELGSLEEQPQMMLGGAATLQHCEQQLHKSSNIDHQGTSQFRRAIVDQGPAAAAAAGAVGAAVGELGVQLGAIVKLLQAKQVAEQEFRDKMLVFVECMVVSLHTMAQASARSGNSVETSKNING